MLGIEYKKAPPTVHVMHFQDGRVVRAGRGLSFWYFAPISSIIDVPLASVDEPFVFNEVTADFQQLTIQGQLTYRIVDPDKVSQLIDFTVNVRGGYTSENDPRDLLAQRLMSITQVHAKAITQGLVLKEALTRVEEIVAILSRELRASAAIQMLGVELLDLSISLISPTPEMSRALEAESREVIQQAADQAIYNRRNAAVEEERRIKESELNTEIAVETKRKQIRETKMAADIAVEEQRTVLIDKQVENDRKQADSRAYALEVTMKPVQEMDWKTLMAVSARNGDPRFAISLAFQELAENASKIGQFSVTPDLFQALMSPPPEKNNVRKDSGHN